MGEVRPTVVLLATGVVDRSMITNETAGDVHTAKSGGRQFGQLGMGRREKGRFATTADISTSVMVSYLSGLRTCIKETREQWIIDNDTWGLSLILPSVIPICLFRDICVIGV